MSLQDIQPHISFLGTLIQLGGALLLALLFTLLRPYARRRKYFLTWGRAWLVLSVATACLVVSYNILPAITNGTLDHSSLPVRLLYTLYQFGQLGFYALLGGGTAVYVSGRIPRTGSVIFVLSASVFSVVSVFYAADLNQFVMWQAPIAVLSTGWCAATIHRVPRSRRTLGSRAVGVVFWSMAGLWTLYFVAFATNGFAPPAAPAGGMFGFVVRYNAYLDALTQTALGFGMVVLLMEEAKREADNAHSELAAAHDELRRSSLYDTVTNTMNRLAFHEGLGLDAARGTFGSVMMLDMDNLKTVNDQLGHAAGDTMLRYLVEVLRGALRTSDKLYRWGGDEFLVVFPGADPALIKARIDRMLAGAPALAVGPAGERVSLMVSAGAAAYVSAEGMPAAIEKADSLMYREKHGRKAKQLAQLTPAG